MTLPLLNKSGLLTKKGAWSEIVLDKSDNAWRVTAVICAPPEGDGI